MQIQSTTSSSASQVAPISNAAQDIMGKDDFLQLLVTQLRHQDPMSPMENMDFIAQLAQFSSLEQMQNMNSTLNDSIDTDMTMAQSINNSMVTGLIGKEVQVQTDQVSLNSKGEVNLGFYTDDSAVKASLSVYDENGTLVYNKDINELKSGPNSITWDGKNNKGEFAGKGTYKFQVELLDANAQSTSAFTYLKGNVAAIRYFSDGALIEVNGQMFNVGNVLEVRTEG